MDLSSLLFLKYEMLLTGIIFILLVLKIDGRAGNQAIIRLTNILLFATLLLGLGESINDHQLMGQGQILQAHEVFSRMFRTTPLIVIEKSVLLLATLIISLASFEWLKKHEHLPEFYILLLSSLLGLFFMISSGNLLMFYLALELIHHSIGGALQFRFG